MSFGINWITSDIRYLEFGFVSVRIPWLICRINLENYNWPLVLLETVSSFERFVLWTKHRHKKHLNIVYTHNFSPYIVLCVILYKDDILWVLTCVVFNHIGQVFQSNFQPLSLQA